MLYNVLLYARCSAETAIINLMVFLIHVVLRSGAEMFPLDGKKFSLLIVELCDLHATFQSVFTEAGELTQHITSILS